MNGEMVKKHLDYFVLGYTGIDDYFSVSSIQKHCRIGYNNAKRVMDLGIKTGDFEVHPTEQSKAKFSVKNASI